MKIVIIIGYLYFICNHPLLNEFGAYSNIGDIDTPDLIRVFNIKVSKKIWADILGMITFAEIGLGIDGVNAHKPHNSSDLFTVNQYLVIASNNLRDCSIPPGGVSRMYFIDSAHDE